MSAKKSKRGKKAGAKPTAAGSGSYASALRAATEKSGAAKSRIRELGKLTTPLCEHEDAFRGVLQVLKDGSEAPELRRAALRTLQAASFSVVKFNPRRAKYLAALRGLVKDPDEEIRQSVLGILAREHDGHAQALLLEGLEDPTKAVVPIEKALQLLAYDVHSDAYSAARKIAKKPPTPEAKREALRLLGADASSIPLFESLLRNKQEPSEFRRLSASALQTLDPKKLQAHAREIVLDDDEDDDLRATGLTVLSQFGATEELTRDEELRKKTSQIEQRGASVIKESAQAFLAKYHKKRRA